MMGNPQLRAKLPRSGPARRALQEKGQFWTPEWVAEAMGAFVLEGAPRIIFDPAVGAGAFFSACRRLGYKGRFSGYERDPEALAIARSEGLAAQDLRDVVVGDFLQGQHGRYAAILSNPPYLRHHRIGAAMKSALRFELRRSTDVEIDGRAGLHVYFLIWCLQHLAPGGRLAFILPADTCEGVFAEALWSWMTRNFRLHSVVTFAPEASPFPGVDTNAFVVAMENAPPGKEFVWTRLEEPVREELEAALLGGANSKFSHEFSSRDISEALSTGFTRPPRSARAGKVVLGDVAQVRRGIATGANEFFFLTRQEIIEHGLDKKWFIRAVGRTRDCPGDSLDKSRLEELDEAGRPTYLLNLPVREIAGFPPSVQNYLAEGEREGYPDRPLIKSRKIWFRSEQRKPPPILFAYLGRRACRFVLNRAGIVPLTGFLCVYPRPEINVEPEVLWRLLNEKETLDQLMYVGKSYGSGAIKVEPRALERLPLPDSVCSRYGLEAAAGMKQMRLMEKRGSYIPGGKSRKSELIT